MITLQNFQLIALSFPDTDQAFHFDLISFRVHKKYLRPSTFWKKDAP